jgi:hypothetical protein
VPYSDSAAAHAGIRARSEPTCEDGPGARCSRASVRRAEMRCHPRGAAVAARSELASRVVERATPATTPWAQATIAVDHCYRAPATL